MDQLHLPMELEDDIPSHHLVRVVNEAVSRLEDRIFRDAYPGGGRDSYHKRVWTNKEQSGIPAFSASGPAKSQP
ncbi:hypothetical protein D3C73_1531670 [compost metagenome]